MNVERIVTIAMNLRYVPIPLEASTVSVGLVLEEMELFVEVSISE